MKKILLSIMCLLALTACTSTSKANQAKAPVQPAGPKVVSTHLGKASWYEIKCNGGTATASGEKLNDYAMTAAHKTLPMGTKVRVTNKHNGKSVVVRINDRGPFIKGRIIDVTKGAAQKLGFIKAGVVPVKVEVLKKG
ncbi:MAG: septal ring lytic transglycosylase RlpA family protein [Verrucomicrobiales bacterium]